MRLLDQDQHKSLQEDKRQYSLLPLISLLFLFTNFSEKLPINTFVYNDTCIFNFSDSWSLCVEIERGLSTINSSLVINYYPQHIDVRHNNLQGLWELGKPDECSGDRYDGLETDGELAVASGDAAKMFDSGPKEPFDETKIVPLNEVALARSMAAVLSWPVEWLCLGKAF